jgi:glycosyltransferase involved in cell wall biosynthesis
MPALYQSPPPTVGHAKSVDLSECVDLPKRVDLHCHSRASTEADEAVLLAIQCPESYSEPLQVHAQAKRRGMDFVTITDHDTIAGVTEISHLPEVIIGEELTCWFPEDQCKMHVLVWGIDRTIHETLQKLAGDIYQVAAFIARNRIAHAVAHPLYRQNGKLERRHLERLMLLFKGFECLNGAHSMLHRDAFEPMLNELNETRILRLQREHELTALWPKPWIKVRTGGSDDHGLFNIGRTWTEFPANVTTAAEVLECLREGGCRPGGEAGSSVKLAHNFYGVGIRYFTRQFSRSGGSSDSRMLDRLVGDAAGAPSRLATAAAGLKYLGGRTVRKVSRAMGLRGPARGTELLAELFSKNAVGAIKKHDLIRQAFSQGSAPLAEHDPMFDLMSDISRRTAQGIGDSISAAIKGGQLGTIFDSVSAVLGHQAMLLPYYFALFHQNQERHLLSRITGHGRRIERGTLRVGMFTDSLDPRDAAGRFARVLAETAGAQRSQLSIAVCSDQPPAVFSGSVNHFEPLAQQDLGAMGGKIVIPPLLEMLEWADRGQFDVVLVNTCGPVGLCGWLVAQMLRAPMLAMYHRDLPTDVLTETGGDYRMTAAARGYARWFYGQAARILSTSRAGSAAVEALELAPQPLTSMVPEPFDRLEPLPVEQRLRCWQRHRVREPIQLVCPIRGCTTGDLELMAGAFERIWQRRQDVALVLVGRCPNRAQMQKQLRGLPAYFVEPSDANDARNLNVNGDLLLCAGKGGLCGHDVLEALCAGVPPLTRAESASSEFVEDRINGRVLGKDDPAIWAAAVLELLGDEGLRQRMGRTGRQRVRGIRGSATFDAVWQSCLRAAEHLSPPATSLSKPAEPRRRDQSEYFTEAAQI